MPFAPDILVTSRDWVVDCAAPAHHKKKSAVDLLRRAATGELNVCLPSICLNEARRPIQELKPRHEADAIRQFLRWAKVSGKEVVLADHLIWTEQTMLFGNQE